MKKEEIAKQIRIFIQTCSSDPKAGIDNSKYIEKGVISILEKLQLETQTVTVEEDGVTIISNPDLGWNGHVKKDEVYYELKERYHKAEKITLEELNKRLLQRLSEAEEKEKTLKTAYLLALKGIGYNEQEAENKINELLTKSKLNE